MGIVGGDASLVRPVGRVSEDCLYLNVMTTGLHDRNLQPVMLWIHGGGGVNGRGDGAFNLVKQEQSSSRLEIVVQQGIVDGWRA